jgi:hypothetical protein
MLPFIDFCRLEWLRFCVLPCQFALSIAGAGGRSGRNKILSGICSLTMAKDMHATYEASFPGARAIGQNRDPDQATLAFEAIEAQLAGTASWTDGPGHVGSASRV